MKKIFTKHLIHKKSNLQYAEELQQAIENLNNLKMEYETAKRTLDQSYQPRIKFLERQIADLSKKQLEEARNAGIVNTNVQKVQQPDVNQNISNLINQTQGSMNQSQMTGTNNASV